VTADRRPIPDGTVSRIRGRWQAPGLRLLVRAVLVVSIVGGLLGGQVGRGLAAVAVAAVIAGPLARVCWLLLRWTQERDARFVLLGIAVIVVVSSGGVMAALGVGG